MARVAIGARLLWLATPAVWLASSAQTMQLGGGWWRGPVLVAYGGVEAIWLTGCWLITSPDPAKPLADRAVRASTRAAIGAIVLLKCTSMALWTFAGWYAVTGPLPLLTMTAGAGTYAGTVFHLVSLMQRCRDARRFPLSGYFAAGGGIMLVAALWGNGIDFVPDAHGAILAAIAIPLMLAVVFIAALELMLGALAALGLGAALAVLHVKYDAASGAGQAAADSAKTARGGHGNRDSAAGEMSSGLRTPACSFARLRTGGG